MTNEEMLLKIKKYKEISVSDTSKDELLQTMIEIAKSLALRKLYPFHLEIVDLPQRYDYWIIQAVGDMYGALGKEQISSYEENGLKIAFRELENGVSQSLLESLIPQVYVVGEEVYNAN